MSNFNIINNVPVSEIEKIPVRKVVLGKTVYSTRYDEENGIIYYLNDQGQLTGEFQQVAVVEQSATPDQADKIPHKKVKKKELKKQLAEKAAEHAESALRLKKEKHKKANENSAEYFKEKQPDAEQQLFHPKVFIAGMAVILICAVLYFLISAGGIL